ncbi:ankyrin repeat domain-containing protein [candidate division GN15 bacterium]|nr:ankyrin repeat domain-containing protein [candidate division GN15 bacterium]
MLAQQSPASTEDKPSPFDPDLVHEFVVAGHGNLPRVKELLLRQPNLVFATWDWGGGDFETALEGAGHVGNRAIAEYLIAGGARPNLFVLTMLGYTEIVTATLTAYPHLAQAKGPHGFTLLHHALQGGEEAADLVTHLRNLGLTKRKLPL